MSQYKPVWLSSIEHKMENTESTAHCFCSITMNKDWGFQALKKCKSTKMNMKVAHLTRALYSQNLLKSYDSLVWGTDQN